jgi:hypothetical protein
VRNGITRIRGRSKELAFDLLAACHGGDLALISQDDEVALCHGADSLPQSHALYHCKELRPRVSQLLRTGHSKLPARESKSEMAIFQESPGHLSFRLNHSISKSAPKMYIPRIQNEG